MEVLVFKTSVHTQRQAHQVLAIVEPRLPHYKINFDLEDCDRILRVAHRRGQPEPEVRAFIIRTLEGLRLRCEELED